MPGTGVASEPSFTFVHAAELELDAPPAGVGALPAAVASAVRDASLETLDALVQLTIERGASFLLLSGTICDIAGQGVRAQVRLRQSLARLGERGIPTYIALGEGDPHGGWPALGELPRGVRIFGGDRVETAVVERDGTRLATLHGISATAPEGGRRPAPKFERSDPDGLELGVLPCDVAEGPGGPSYCRLDSIRKARLDYWAVGRARGYRIVNERDPWIVAPGTHQGRGLDPGELGEKGVVVVMVRAGAIAPPEFVALDRVRYVETELDASLHRDIEDLAAGLTARASRLSEQYPGRGLVVRGVVQGQGPMQAALRRPGATSTLLDMIRQRATRLDPFVWWDSVVDRTPSTHDRDLIRRRTDLSAEVAGLVDALLAGAQARAAFFEMAGAGLPSERLAPWLKPAPSDDDGVLRAAEQLAFDELEGARQ